MKFASLCTLVPSGPVHITVFQVRPGFLFKQFSLRHFCLKRCGMSLGFLDDNVGFSISFQARPARQPGPRTHRDPHSRGHTHARTPTLVHTRACAQVSVASELTFRYVFASAEMPAYFGQGPARPHHSPGMNVAQIPMQMWPVPTQMWHKPRRSSCRRCGLNPGAVVAFQQRMWHTSRFAHNVELPTRISPLPALDQLNTCPLHIISMPKVCLVLRSVRGSLLSMCGRCGVRRRTRQHATHSMQHTAYTPLRRSAYNDDIGLWLTSPSGRVDLALIDPAQPYSGRSLCRCARKYRSVARGMDLTLTPSSRIEPLLIRTKSRCSIV